MACDYLLSHCRTAEDDTATNEMSEPVTHPNLYGQDSLELAAQSASRVHKCSARAGPGGRVARSQDRTGGAGLGGTSKLLRPQPTGPANMMPPVQTGRAIPRPWSGVALQRRTPFQPGCSSSVRYSSAALLDFQVSYQCVDNSVTEIAILTSAGSQRDRCCTERLKSDLELFG